MKKRLITSALPYVNNIPHLGNLIQVLSADVFARFCRSRGYETLYVCGTDEYGTATETRAREEGLTPKELCDRYYAVHTDIYEWFEIAFDKWGRTSTPEHTKITQDIFLKLHAAGYITEKTIEQLYCESADMYLADRYVRGTCPHCGYEDARGDQCENCGKLLDPMDLIDPRSALDGSVPVVRETTHLYIDLPAVLPKLQEWMNDASVRGRWARNAVQMTQAWIRDGLRERAITRDLKWGIPVPLEGFEDKVFYVWFDAPIGYISMTANHTDRWDVDWWKNPEEVELFQFVGKDNIPFHTVIFPSSLLGSGDKWTLLHHMSSSEYLNYEGGQFSKSKGVGVFGNDARDTGIPADVWRFYIFYNRPETSDYTFTWHDFQEKVNGELIGNLANLVNRTLTFLARYFGGEVAGGSQGTGGLQGASDSQRAGVSQGASGVQGAGGSGGRLQASEFWAEVRKREAGITDKLEWAGLRDGLRQIFALSSYGNRVFQAGEPWKTRETDPEGTHALLSDLVYLIRDLTILIEPYLPATARRLREMLGVGELKWSDLGVPTGLTKIGTPEILFKQLPDELIEELRVRFSGSQAERAARDAAESGKNGADGNSGADSNNDPDGRNRADGNNRTDSDNGKGKAVKGSTVEGQEKEKDQELDAPKSPEDRFDETIELRAAKIVEVERHPEADKLYVETLDDGSEEGRTIVSGLVSHYAPEELLNRTIIVVANLKPAKLRGVKSNGMLLAASSESGDGGDSSDSSESGDSGDTSDSGGGQEIVDVLFVDHLAPGTRLYLEGRRPTDETAEGTGAEGLKRIKIDQF
ncbi:MAG: methionine--tRNA ligase, partial [Alkalispirochaeta sp.]